MQVDKVDKAHVVYKMVRVVVYAEVCVRFRSVAYACAATLHQLDSTTATLLSYNIYNGVSRFP